jgi:hypothetical protein
MDTNELKKFLVELIHEEFTPNPSEIAPKWDGGSIILKPSNDSQPKDVPMDVFFRKIVGIRDALRVLEQKINTHPQLTMEDKSNFQAYITKCYGSMTTFNILFRDDKDRFVGTGGSGSGSGEKDAPRMTLGEAKKKMGFNEIG